MNIYNALIFRLLLRLGFRAQFRFKLDFFEKFGCPPEKSHFLLRKARELNLDLVGIAFHIGLGFKDVKVFKTSIETCAKTFDFGKSLGFEMRILDIGGGYPGNDLEEFVNNFLFTLGQN